MAYQQLRAVLVTTALALVLLAGRGLVPPFLRADKASELAMEYLTVCTVLAILLTTVALRRLVKPELHPGFPLTAADQLRYNRWIAGLAHSRGMSVALKNDVEQVGALEPFFDFAVNEQCVEFDECEALMPFIRAGKAVLHVEYGLSKAQFCAKTRVLGFSSMRKPQDLGPASEPC